jgi:hypothetical protein
MRLFKTGQIMGKHLLQSNIQSKISTQYHRITTRMYDGKGHHSLAIEFLELGMPKSSQGYITKFTAILRPCTL